MPRTASAIASSFGRSRPTITCCSKSGRARVVKPNNSAHFSVRYCLTASPSALEARLKQLTDDDTMRFACINYLEAVVDKVPDGMRYLSDATGPAAPFENARPRKAVS